jgi:trehalose 6-phosphate phosphatase
MLIATATRTPEKASVSVRVEIRCLTKFPSQTPAIAGTPMRRASGTSMFPSSLWANAPTAAVMRIEASEVAVATLASNASHAISSGTMMMPPPTPNRAEKKPATAPITSSAAIPARGLPAPLASAPMTVPPDVARALTPLREDPSRAAVLLDFDGTLSPIVPSPEEARLVEGAREAVDRLTGRYGLVAFVSGRGLGDLEERVGIEGVAYAGNHGMERRSPEGERIVDAAAEPFLGRMADMARAFEPAELAAEGVHLEDKGVTLSFHSRRAPDQERAERFLSERIAAAAESRGLRPTWGRKVLEIRPPVRVDKGTAARALVLDAGARTAVYVGDDRTDADAWRALRERVGVGLRAHAAAIPAVGHEVPDDLVAAADGVVEGPEGAVDVIRWLGEG